MEYEAFKEAILAELKDFYGKDADAIGFALSLDLLERFETTEREYDVDTLLLYDDGTDTAALAQAAQMLTSPEALCPAGRSGKGGRRGTAARLRDASEYIKRKNQEKGRGNVCGPIQLSALRSI